MYMIIKLYLRCKDLKNLSPYFFKDLKNLSPYFKKSLNVSDLGYIYIFFERIDPPPPYPKYSNNIDSLQI